MPDRLFALRALALYVPVALAFGLWRRRQTSGRTASGLVLGTVWNFTALVGVNALAVRVGWWGFGAPGAELLGVPVDVVIGWAVLWGIVAPLAAPRASIASLSTAAVIVDLIVMPLCAPLVVLGEGWLIGEMVAVVIAFIPGILLARWTRDDRELPVRAGMLVMLFASLVLGVLPETIFAHAEGSWSALAGKSPRRLALELQLVAIPALLGVSALQEFVERGRGTPLPFDPPRRLVTTGPYAYVANPMQLSTALLLLTWGAVMRSWWVAAAGVMAWVYSVGLARLDEGVDLERRFGESWKSYRQHLRNWVPRWRPAHPPARLYVAMGCRPCSELAQWFTASGAVSLEIVPAELHPHRDLRRLTYELVADPASREEGVRALARAVEHIHLGWAMIAFFARLPGVSQLLQVLADVSGGEQKLVVREVPECPAEPSAGGLNISAR